MNISLKRLAESLRMQSLGATWVTLWMALSTSLATALYVTMLCLYKLLVALQLEAPGSGYFWIANGTFLGVVSVVLCVGVYAAHQMCSIDREVRHALHSVREGDLSTRLDLTAYPECSELERAFNDAMEVVQHRVETSSANRS